MPKIKPYAMADQMALGIDAVRVRFGEVVRELLKEQGLTQTALAEAIPIDNSTLSTYLTGTRQINDLACVVGAARRLGVTVGYLVGETTDVADAKIQAILEACRELPTEALDALLAMARVLPKKPPSPKADRQ
jgi:transcriptional regulator with XRE-family HTH domain